MKIPALFLIFLFCSIGTNAQTYHPFPTANAMWSEGTASLSYYCSNIQYQITGDTAISSQTYHKLLKTVVNYETNPFAGCTGTRLYSYTIYAGAFRNDTAGKKVFVVLKDSLSELLLYDFNLNVGDTIPNNMSNGFSSPGPFLVESIDSVQVGSDFHRRFQIDNCPTMSSGDLYWIEGVGSTFGLLSGAFCPFEDQSYLGCFTLDSITMYPAGNYPCEMIYAGVSPSEFDNKKPWIYPNPAADIIQINNPIPGKKGKLEIFNISGQSVWSQADIDEQEMIDLSVLKPGVYLVVFKNDNHHEKSVLVKQ